MTLKHDALRQISYIQQALSQSKKPIGFFIGAGCPLAVRVNQRNEDGKEVSDPIIPDVAGLTQKISDKLKATAGTEETAWDKLISLMVEDGVSSPNIEDILTQVRALRSVAGNGTVRG